MIASKAERLNYLKELQQKHDPTQNVRLYYKEENRIFPVYRIDLRYLIFNRHNGRLESEMQTWESEVGPHTEAYDSSIHEQIAEFLWASNIGKNRKTLKDIEQRGQQKPGIVTLDGVIIDGNRRAMLLQKLHQEYFEAVILPDAYDDNERAIVKLETQYQLGEDQKVDYGPLEKYLHAKRLRDLSVAPNEAANLMGVSTSDYERYLAIMQLMDEYLQYLDCSGLYNLLKESDGSTKEGMFVDLYSDLAKLSKGAGPATWDFIEADLYDLKCIQFDHIKCGTDIFEDGKDYRKISHGSSETRKCFFAHEDIWAEFKDRHYSAVENVEPELETIDDFAEESGSGHKTRVDLARNWLGNWKEAVNAPFRRNFGLAREQLEYRAEELEPTRLLRRALNSLERIDLESEEILSSQDNRELVIQINRIAYEIKKRFDRHG